MHIKIQLSATTPDGVVRSFKVDSLEALDKAVKTIRAAETEHVMGEPVTHFLREMVVVTGKASDRIGGNRLAQEFSEWKSRLGHDKLAGRNFLYKALRQKSTIGEVVHGNKVVFTGLKLVGLVDIKATSGDDDLI